MVDFTEFFKLFDFSTWGEGLNGRFYWIFSTFRLFNLLLWGQTDRFYWIYWVFAFSTFRPLAGSSNWSILLNILDFFDFSSSWWEVKMIDFTEYIEFFRLFDFLTFRWEFKMINFTECIEFFRLFDLLLGGQTDRFYWICWILFVFWTFRTLAGRSKWLILLNI